MKSPSREISAANVLVKLPPEGSKSPALAIVFPALTMLLQGKFTLSLCRHDKDSIFEMHLKCGGKIKGEGES